MSRHFLAFDLGAESGRAMLARLEQGALSLTEVHRWRNEPVRSGRSLRWDILRLWHEMIHGLHAVDAGALDSMGVDTWGCDYALIGENGELLDNPYHYRDSRTDGVMDAVMRQVPRDEIYATTGIQFMPFNTLYQLHAACAATPRLIDAAVSLGTIPDLLNYWLTGELRAEYTNATTTQMVDAGRRTWALGMLERLHIPTRLLPPLIEPGAVLGQVGVNVSARFAGTPVVVPACHDTGSAVASVATGAGTAFLSSGTWSLLGAELDSPVITANARDRNFTNEGGVCGTTRLLKNVTGMWLLESCRRRWAADGGASSYDDLIGAAGAEPTPFRSLFDPDHGSFLHPTDMVDAIAAYCARTGQPVPGSPAAYVRAILESIALKYRYVLDVLGRLVGTPFTQIRVVGGGARNRLLNQFTADATGCTVAAGPIEATALGNIAMQLLATGAVRSLGDARRIINDSFPVERFEPAAGRRWDGPYERFQEYVGLTCV